jgi:hypothetical protein
VYLALGDSMSIDMYTGVEGGGAVTQFHRRLGAGWKLNDCSFDGCTMDAVPYNLTGEVITVTVGGNDALIEMDRVKTDGVSFLVRQHLKLLKSIRHQDPHACFIVGNIYAPQTPLSAELMALLAQLNEGIGKNVVEVGAYLADIRSAFVGHESTHLCEEIEPTLAGATTIAGLFYDQYQLWHESRRYQSASQ